MTDQTLVVIGVGGMGQAIARRTGLGLKVALADFNEELLASTAEALRGDGYDVDTYTVDVSSAESVRKLAADVAAKGTIVKVAHTAGLSPSQAPAAAILRVDLVGVANMLDAFGEVIAEGGSGVVISSMSAALMEGRYPAELDQAFAFTPTDELLDLPLWKAPEFANGGAAYALSKRANQLRVQTASVAWGKRGARVNSISPGVISTPMGAEELASESGAGMRAMIAGSGTGRIGTAGDIAAAADWLLGKDATFVTGIDLRVDGGAVAAVRSGVVSIG